MELQTTIGEGRAIVTAVYTVEIDSVPCWDGASGREYEESIRTVTLDKVLFNGVDIMGALNQEQLEELEAECEEAEEVEA